MPAYNHTRGDSPLYPCSICQKELLETVKVSKEQMLSNVIAFAAEKHKNQFDRGGLPYILHPLKVMHYTRSNDLELMAIAVLHDVLEDTDATVKDLVKLGCTERVLKGVEALSNIGYTEVEYLENIKSNKDAIKVKLADLRHNSDIRRLKGIREKDVIRMKKYHAMYMELKDLV